MSGDRPPVPNHSPKFRADLGNGENVVVEIESTAGLSHLVIQNMMEYMVPKREIFLGLVANKVSREKSEMLVKACAACCEYVTQQSFDDQELDVEVMQMYLLETLRMDPQFLNEVLEGLLRFSNAG